MTDPVDALDDAIQVFERAYMKLLDEIDAANGDRQPLREIFAKLDKAIKRLKGSQDYLAGRLGLKHGKLVPAAGGVLEGKHGKDRKAWDHVALKSIVSEKIVAKHLDPESGTLAVPPVVLMLDMLNMVSFSSWKVTELRKLGMDNEQIARYCEETPGRFNVVVRFPSESPIPKEEENE